MAFATLPSPLYGIYKVQDHLSSFTITVVYAIFAAGTITALLAEDSRRGTTRTPWRDARGSGDHDGGGGTSRRLEGLPVLIVGRLLTGVAAGLAAGDGDHVPHRTASARRPGRVDGPRPDRRHVDQRRCARRRPAHRRLPGGMGELAAHLVLPGDPRLWARSRWSACALCPKQERRQRTERAHQPTQTHAKAAGPSRSRDPGRLRRKRPVRRARRTHLGRHTRAHLPRLGRGHPVLGVLLRRRLPGGNDQAERVAGAGPWHYLRCSSASSFSWSRFASRPRAWRSSWSPVRCIGAGVGAVFKGTTGIVLEAAAPEDRLAMTSRLLVVLYVGLSIPVVGAGIALNQGASIPNTVLAFAILVAIGVSVSGWVLLVRRTAGTPEAR